jgi:hypothetical protein
MAQMNLAETVRILKEHFGERVTGTKDEGRDLMAQALQDQLGLSKDEARDAVDALERAHTIRWRDTPTTIGTVAQATMPFAEALGAENPAGAATSAQAPLDAGYWQL